MPRLKDLRKARKMYQRDVAQHLGVDRTTYAKYETGDISLPLDVAFALADFYGIHITEVIGTEKAIQQKPDGRVGELQSLCSQLTPENQEKAASYLRYLVEREQSGTAAPPPDRQD